MEWAVVTACAPAGDDPHARIHAWDHKSGCLLRAFRGGTGRKRGMALNARHLLASHPTKSALSLWNWGSEQLALKIPTPERLSSIVLAGAGCYCIAGGESGRLYLWEVYSGRLLRVVQGAHFRQVGVLAATPAGTHILSGSDDSLVNVWQLSSLVSASLDTPKPLYRWNDHSLPVTAIYCGVGGLAARCVTASRDRTCKMWELSSGKLLCSVALPSEALAVALDVHESQLFAGCSNGSVYRVRLWTREVHIRAAAFGVEADPESRMRGHTAAISGLAVSPDGSTVISSSDDGCARVWDAQSCECLRIYKHKGPVTNCFVVPKSYLARTRTGGDQVAFFAKFTKEATARPLKLVPKRRRRNDGSDGAVTFDREEDSFAERVRHGVRRVPKQDDALQQALDARAASQAEQQEWRKVALGLYELATDRFLEDLEAAAEEVGAEAVGEQTAAAPAPT